MRIEQETLDHVMILIQDLFEEGQDIDPMSLCACLGLSLQKVLVCLVALWSRELIGGYHRVQCLHCDEMLREEVGTPPLCLCPQCGQELSTQDSFNLCFCRLRQEPS